MNQEAVNNLTSGVTAATYTVGTSTVFLGFNVEQWGIIGVLTGVVTTLGMAAFNIWFKLKYVERRSTNTNEYYRDDRRNKL